VTVEQVGAACHTGAHRCFDVDPLEPVTASAPDGAASDLAGAPSAVAGGAVEETR
jgi:phosphoribosyl-AMP cyclohydrolase